jgi:hypothetical protein
VHRNGKIKWIHVRHEETAAYAAGAEAQLNGLACCTGSCVEFTQMKGFALYMGKMMLSGRMDEVFNVISSNYKHLGEVL